MVRFVEQAVEVMKVAVVACSMAICSRRGAEGCKTSEAYYRDRLRSAGARRLFEELKDCIEGDMTGYAEDFFARLRQAARAEAFE
jgi:hypothetical protein